MVSLAYPKNIGKTPDLLTLVSSVLTFDRILRVRSHRGYGRLAPWILGAMTVSVITPAAERHAGIADGTCNC